MTSSGRPPGLRERKKAQTRRRIQEEALRLFLAQGYDKTTVEEIAAAAGVSHMTFFRYFTAKEAVVDTDDYDPMILRLIQERPANEDSLTALHRALLQGLSEIYARDRDTLLVRTELILNTPALRARMWDNQHATELLFVEGLASRPAGQQPTLRTRVLAAASLAALNTALSAWVDSGGVSDLPNLVDEAFHALRSAADPM